MLTWSIRLLLLAHISITIWFIWHLVAIFVQFSLETSTVVPAVLLISSDKMLNSLRPRILIQCSLIVPTVPLLFNGFILHFLPYLSLQYIVLALCRFGTMHASNIFHVYIIMYLSSAPVSRYLGPRHVPRNLNVLAFMWAVNDLYLFQLLFISCLKRGRESTSDFNRVIAGTISLVLKVLIIHPLIFLTRDIFLVFF